MKREHTHKTFPSKKRKKTKALYFGKQRQNEIYGFNLAESSPALVGFKVSHDLKTIWLKLNTNK